MKADYLLEIFYKHLKKNTTHPLSKEDFIHNVVADYIFHLMNVGHIPASILDPLEADLKEEVHELYQKLMAGPIKKVQASIQRSHPKPRRPN